MRVQNRIETTIEEFQYPSSGLPGPSIWQEIPAVGREIAWSDEAESVNKADPLAERHDKRSEETIDDKVQKSFEAGRAQGLREGRQLERAEQRVRSKEIEEEKIESVAQIAKQFECERVKFVEAVEPEAVKLALGIAARILRHEAQMDPVFLAGAVRVALGQLADSVEVRLRVPSADCQLWTETIAHLPSLRVKPKVVGDDKLCLGDCLVETEMGSVDLGAGSQIKEISRLFFEGLPSECGQEPSEMRVRGSGEPS